MPLENITHKTRCATRLTVAAVKSPRKSWFPGLQVIGFALATCAACTASPLASAADVYVSYAADGTPSFASQARNPSYVLLLKDPEPLARAIASARAPDGSAMRKRREALDPLIRQTADRHGIDPALMRAIAHVESNFDARAVSTAGAVGLMQLMPATATRYGARDRNDPAQNLDAGARYIKDLLAQYPGNLALVLAAYNSGERNVERHAKNLPPFRETMLYVPQVLSRYESYRQAETTPQQK